MLLCHTRLSIVGIGPEGAQPAALPTGQAITFNGEIYNYQEIAAGLGAEASLSDTQAIVRLLARDGMSATDSLRGMYAFAYWDPKLRTLSAARDPWGIKPLYILEHSGGGVTLSSEIGPLLLHSEGREVDPTGIAQYVAFGHTVSQRTCYRRIRKLEPGVVYSWCLSGEGQAGARVQAIDQTRPPQGQSVADAVVDSVRTHLIADVEVGVFLSGGIDSTLLTAIASGYVPHLHAFTLAFPETPSIDESPMAAANAAALGVKHTVVPVTATDMVASLDALLRSTGEPFGDYAALPLMCLAQRASRDLKVVLTGEGADELFGGYGRYRISRVVPRRRFRFVSRTSGRLADVVYERRSDRPRSRAIESLLRLDGPRSHATLLGSDLPAVALADDVGPEIDALLRSDWESLTRGVRGRDAARRFDLGRWLPNTYLEKTDRATMAAGLEARTPFLDPVVATASTSPERPFGKDDLRGALLDRAPNVLLPDRKKGLAVSTRNLLALSLGEDLARVTGSRHSVLHRVLGTDAAEALSKRARYSQATAYRLAVLGRWEALSSVVT